MATPTSTHVRYLAEILVVRDRLGAQGHKVHTYYATVLGIYISAFAHFANAFKGQEKRTAAPRFTLTKGLWHTLTDGEEGGN